MLRAPNRSKCQNLAPETSQATATRLAAIDRACQELAQCDSLSSVKKVRDQAEAFRNYARSAKAGLELLNKAVEFKLRAERRAGQLLAEMKLRGGDRVSNSPDVRATLQQLNINYNQSARWQKVAQVPEENFFTFLAAARENKLELSSAAFLRLATALAKKRPPHNQHATTFDQPPAPTSRHATASLDEIISELQNHSAVVDGILSTIYDTAGPVDLPLADRNHLKRLMREFTCLLADLKQQSASPEYSGRP